MGVQQLLKSLQALQRPLGVAVKTRGPNKVDNQIAVMQIKRNRKRQCPLFYMRQVF